MADDPGSDRLSSPSPISSPQRRPAITDSPWFWMMLFCGGGAVLLAGFSSKYAQRQGRLEMQYQARQETLRRHVEGERPVREPGQEGSAPPPEPGELLIPLRPLLALFGVLFAVAGAILWRAHRAAVAGQKPIEGGPP